MKTVCLFFSSRRRHTRCGRDWSSDVCSSDLFAHSHLNVQVAWGATIYAHFTFARQADAVAGIHAGRHFDRQGFVLANTTLTMTGLAGILDDLARATTGRTGLLHGEEALLHAYLTHALTGTTGFRPGAFFGAAAFTDITFLMTRNLDFDGLAFDRFFQVQLQGVAQVGTAGVAATAATTEDIAEHVSEYVGEAATTTAEATSTGLAVYASVTKLVVRGTFAGVGENFVGFAGLFKLVLGVCVVRVTVRMVFHRELPVRPLYFLLVRVPGNPEHFVIIALGHTSKPCCYNAENAGLPPRFPTA